MGLLFELLGELFVHGSLEVAAKRSRQFRWFINGLCALIFGLLIGWLASEYF